MRKRSLCLLLILLFIASTLDAATILLPRTGQNTCYDAAGSATTCTVTGQDGELQAGVVWPSPRFTDNADGTVSDNLTGLVWLKDAMCAAINVGPPTWVTALANAKGLASGACGLTDASVAGDWRLPNINELESLTDLSQGGPALPTGHFFHNALPSSWYWSSTTSANDTSAAWSMKLDDGYLFDDVKSSKRHVWPVRNDR